MVTVTTWTLKGCPRCGGDLYAEDGGFTCLQCGYHLEVKDEPRQRDTSLPVGAS